MRVSQLTTTTLFMYQYFKSCTYNNNENKVNVQATAAFLNTSRVTVTKHMTALEAMHIVTKSSKSRKDRNGSVCQTWASPVYNVDFVELERYLKNEGVNVPTIAVCLQTYGKYCTFAHEYKLVKDEGSVAQNLLAEVAAKRTEEKINSKTAKLTKQLDYLQSVLNVSNELNYLNNYYGNNYHINFVKELKRRASSKFCGMRNPEKSGDPTRIIEAKKVLKAENVAHYDVKSSYTKIAYGLGTGKVPELTKDTYRTIIDRTDLIGRKLTDEEWQSIREDVKATLFMHTFMKSGSVFYRTVKNREFDDRKTSTRSMRTKYELNMLSEEDRELFEAEERVVAFFKEKGAIYSDGKQSIAFDDYESKDGLLYYIAYAVKVAMQKYFNLNKFFGKNVFYYESALYLKVQYKLLTQYSIETITVYDCFYYDAKYTDFEEKFTAAYKEAFSEIIALATVQKELLKFRAGNLINVKDACQVINSSNTKRSTFKDPIKMSVMTDAQINEIRTLKLVISGEISLSEAERRLSKTIEVF